MAPTTTGDHQAPAPGNDDSERIPRSADARAKTEGPATERTDDNEPESPEEQEDGPSSSAVEENGPCERGSLEEDCGNNRTGGGTSDEDEFESRYNERFRSIRSGTGLEVGILVSWPGTVAVASSTTTKNDDDDTAQGKDGSSPRGWELSTCLSSDCIAPLFHGTQWAGTRVWRAAVVALEYLLSDKEAGVAVGSNHTLLELGCGLGVPGMVLHALRGCTAILTDMGDLIPTVQQNLRNAFPDSVVADNNGGGTLLMRKGGGTIEARELDWSAAGVDRLLHETGVSTFDVVLNCDCIFEPLYGDSWRHLLECQVALLELNPAAYVLTSVERRKYDGIDKYLQAATDAGLVPLPVFPRSIAYPPQVELYRLIRRSPHEPANV